MVCALQTRQFWCEWHSTPCKTMLCI
jgi:hypothetical protein